MDEFWETHFNEKKEMWGFEPAHSAILSQAIFLEHAIQNVLIPGIGYGRNAQVFRNVGMNVTGIELSPSAIAMAHQHFGTDLKIYEGSVTNMPFDQKFYDGIFCHALIHLLDTNERQKLIQDCYRQLSPNGIMIFTVITKEATTYGQGEKVSKDRYELFGGVKLFFYDQESVQKEFGRYGLQEIKEVQENYPFFWIMCQKK